MKKKWFIAGIRNVSERQIPDGSCWRYSEPTPYPGGEKDRPSYMPVKKEVE